MINDRFVGYLESKYLLTNIWRGLKSQRRTTDLFVRLETFFCTEHVASIFCNLEKTYETTWKYGIINASLIWGFEDIYLTWLEVLYIIDILMLGVDFLVFMIREWVYPKIAYYLLLF